MEGEREGGREGGRKGEERRGRERGKEEGGKRREEGEGGRKEREGGRKGIGREGGTNCLVYVLSFHEGKDTTDNLARQPYSSYRGRHVPRPPGPPPVRKRDYNRPGKNDHSTQILDI